MAEISETDTQNGLWNEYNDARINERGIFLHESLNDGKAIAGTVIASSLAPNTASQRYLVRFDNGKRVSITQEAMEEGLVRYTQENGPEPRNCLSKETKSAAFRLIKALCANPYGNWFSQPVTAVYPELEATYHAMISSPMDLGTMYIKLQHDKYESLHELGMDLRRVFRNCRLFNAQNLTLVATCELVERLAASLWVEWLGRGYPPSEDTKDTEEKEEEEAEDTAAHPPMDTPAQQTRVSAAREDTFSFVLDTPLSSDDAQRLLPHLLASFHSKRPPQHALTFPWTKPCPHVSELGKRVMSACISKLQAVTEGQAVVTCTLRWLVKSFVDAFEKIADSSGTSRTEINDVGQLPYVLRTWKQLRSVHAPLLELCVWLDDVIGREVLPFVEERTLRGYDLSSVWARPWKIAWAQPTKSPYWPGLVLAGHNVPEKISVANVHRLPDAIARDLLRSRPALLGAAKATGAQVSALSLRELRAELLSTPQFVIVEFFETHDFGWVRHDCVQFFDGPKSDPNPKQQKKMVPQSAVAEAKQALAQFDAAANAQAVAADIPMVGFLDVSLRYVFPEAEPSPPAATQRAPTVLQPSHSNGKTQKQEASRAFSTAPPMDPGRGFRVSSIFADPDDSMKARALARVRQLVEYLSSYSALVVEGEKTKGTPAKRPRDSTASIASNDTSLDMTVTPQKASRQHDFMDLPFRAVSEEKDYLESNSAPIVIASAVTEESNLTSSVDLQAPLFALEATDREERKRILRAEIARLNEVIARLEQEEQVIEKSKERQHGASTERMKFKVGMISQLTKQSVKRPLDHHAAVGVGSSHEQAEADSDADAFVQQPPKRPRAVMSTPHHSDAEAKESLTPVSGTGHSVSGTPTANDDEEAPAKKARTRKSEFRGVSSVKGKWAAKIDIDGQKCTLGIFETQEEAAHAYDTAATNYYGSAARTNFDEDGVRIYPKRLSKPKSTEKKRASVEPVPLFAAAEPTNEAPNEETQPDDGPQHEGLSSLSLAASMMPML